MHHQIDVVGRHAQKLFILISSPDAHLVEPTDFELTAIKMNAVVKLMTENSALNGRFLI